QHMLEIGPGRGALTIPLLQHLGALSALEIDRDLISALENKCRAYGQLELYTGDALKADYMALSADESLRVVSNLPYTISAPLLFRLLNSPAPITDLHFTLQREVVERLAAQVGTNHYGRLTV